jgi:hypothetical protein
MRAVLVFSFLSLLSFSSYAQIQFTTGETTMINPSGRTLILERDNADSWLTFHDPYDYWYSIGIDRSNGGLLSLNYGGDLTSTHFVMDNNGNIGLGTANPFGWRLAVNGSIRAKEVRVETSWADFVFEETYHLPDLEEVEAHIREKGHLKDIPSAEEVAKNGIYLGEMNSKLLQKIEELTLYLIQQNKTIEELTKQKNTLEELLRRVEQLEREHAKKD